MGQKAESQAGANDKYGVSYGLVLANYVAACTNAPFQYNAC